MILFAGEAPPLFTPYCQRCDMPVERHRMDMVRVTGQDFVVIHASCCGQHSSSRVALSLLSEMARTGKKFFAIVRAGLAPGLRGRSTTLRSISH